MNNLKPEDYSSFYSRIGAEPLEFTDHDGRVWYTLTALNIQTRKGLEEAQAQAGLEVDSTGGEVELTAKIKEVALARAIKNASVIIESHNYIRLAGIASPPQGKQLSLRKIVFPVIDKEEMLLIQECTITFFSTTQEDKFAGQKSFGLEQRNGVYDDFISKLIPVAAEQVDEYLKKNPPTGEDVELEFDWSKI